MRSELCVRSTGSDKVVESGQGPPAAGVSAWGARRGWRPSRSAPWAALTSSSRSEAPLPRRCVTIMSRTWATRSGAARRKLATGADHGPGIRAVRAPGTGGSTRGGAQAAGHSSQCGRGPQVPKRSQRMHGSLPSCGWPLCALCRTRWGLVRLPVSRKAAFQNSVYNDLSVSGLPSFLRCRGRRRGQCAAGLGPGHVAGTRPCLACAWQAPMLCCQARQRPSAEGQYAGGCTGGRLTA